MSSIWARTDFWPTDRVAAPVVDDYARGLADGRRTVEAELGSDREALSQLVGALEALSPPSPEALMSMMLATVERLVSDIVGAAPVDAVLLNERMTAMVVFIAGEVEPVLALHPDDVALLDDAQLVVQIVADPALSRGTVEARTSGLVVEDGVVPALERMRHEFLRLGLGT